MSPEQLRETIVQAAIPFIAEWDAVTTEQIARAAGIDEATLLGVFNDKEAALTAAIQALVMAALDPTQVVQELHSIPLDQPLAARLVEAIDASTPTTTASAPSWLPWTPPASSIAHRRPTTTQPGNPAPDSPTTRTSAPSLAWTSSAKPSPNCWSQTSNTCDCQPEPWPTPSSVSTP